VIASPQEGPDTEEPPVTAASRKVDDFIDGATRWRQEMARLREVLLDCAVTEDFKWGKPCYTAHGGNIVIMQPFEAHLSLMFFKGALLDDPDEVLRSQGENTRAALRMEFTGPEQVSERSRVVKAYVQEAVAVEEAGLEVPRKKVEEYDVPAELETRLGEDEAYRDAWEALTPGRRKGYLIHFSGAKRANTRERRVERCRTRILEGKGLNER
jgi:uncharacterized protein YdeI (YjbR/CyaY-like superfamily)